MKKLTIIKNREEAIKWANNFNCRPENDLPGKRIDVHQFADTLEKKCTHKTPEEVILYDPYDILGN